MEPVSVQQLGKHVPTKMHATEERCFLCDPCRDVGTIVQLSSAREAVKIESERVTPLEAVDEERLMRQTVKGLAGAVVICKVRRLAVAL
jgi:hypothetical protein